MRTFSGIAPSSPERKDVEMALGKAGGGRVFLSNTSYAELLVSELETIQYEALVSPESEAASGFQIGVNIPISKTEGNNPVPTEKTLVFEPLYVTQSSGQAVTRNEWQTWGGPTTSEGWWVKGETGECADTNPCTLSELTGKFGTWTIGDEGIRFTVGNNGYEPSGGWNRFDGYVDNILIATAEGSTLFDFETTPALRPVPNQAETDWVRTAPGPAKVYYQDLGAAEVGARNGDALVFETATEGPSAGYATASTSDLDGKLLTSVEELTYRSRVFSNNGNDEIAPALRITLDPTASPTDSPITIVYEPDYENEMAYAFPGKDVNKTEWQTWDTQAGVWWYGDWQFRSWDDILQDLPEAKITDVAFAAGQNEASPWMGFRGAVDDFTWNSGGFVTSYDFRQETAPVVTAVNIVQTEVRTNDVLTAKVEASDADSATEPLTLHYEWLKNGAVVHTGSTLDLSKPGYGDLGDRISLRVSATDSRNYRSVNKTSSDRPVLNTAPRVGGVSMSPAQPHSNSMVSAQLSGVVDPDGNVRAEGYQWFKNGVAIPGATHRTIDLSATGMGDANDTLQVSAYVKDAFTQSNTVASSVVTIAAAPAPAQTQTPAPTQTTPAPSQTQTPTPRPTTTPTATPSASPSPTPSSTPSATPTPSPSPSVEGKTVSRSWTVLSIEKNNGGLRGDVLAADDVCSDNREVTIRKVRDGADRVVGRDFSNSRGVWTFDPRLRPGKYYATVRAVEIEIDEYTGVACDAARTRAVKVRRMDRRWM